MALEGFGLRRKSPAKPKAETGSNRFPDWHSICERVVGTVPLVSGMHKTNSSSESLATENLGTREASYE